MARGSSKWVGPRVCTRGYENVATTGLCCYRLFFNSHLLPLSVGQALKSFVWRSVKGVRSRKRTLPAMRVFFFASFRNPRQIPCNLRPNRIVAHQSSVCSHVALDFCKRKGCQDNCLVCFDQCGGLPPPSGAFFPFSFLPSNDELVYLNRKIFDSRWCQCRHSLG